MYLTHYIFVLYQYKASTESSSFYHTQSDNQKALWMKIFYMSVIVDVYKHNIDLLVIKKKIWEAHHKAFGVR